MKSNLGRAVRRSTIVVALAASAAAAAGPVALRSPTVFAPAETGGFGLSPEVAARLSIDARGVVAAVEVVSITPPSEFDTLFREEVVRTLSDWRFAPATEGGQPVASRLDLRFKLPAQQAELPGPLQVTSPLAGIDAETRRAAVLSMPLAARRKLLERESRAAIGHLDPAKTRQAQTARFIVTTDADREGTAESIANNLEAIYNLLARDIVPGIVLGREPLKVNVFAYRTNSQYQALIAELFQYEFSAGYYSPSGLIALHLEQPTSDYLMSILLHEATHAFMDRHVVRPGVALPRWLGEGFAEYVGNSAVQKGVLKPGKTFVHRYAIEQGRMLSFDTRAGVRRDEAQQALRRGKGIGLPQMLAASPDIFYGEGRTLYYATAWLLVHFLRDGTPQSAERFSRLLLYLAEGYPPSAALRSIYGELDATEATFRAYVKDF